MQIAFLMRKQLERLVENWLNDWEEQLRWKRKHTAVLKVRNMSLLLSYYYILQHND